jgi:hypothetical protein
MSDRKLSWFKHGIPYDAKFTGFKINRRNGVANRCWQRVTVFVMTDDRIDAIREVQRVAGQYGYQNVTVDHMVRLR